MSRFVIVVAVLLAGCTAPVSLESDSSEVMPVVRYCQFRVFDPVYIGVEKGFFEKRGVKVEFMGDVLAGPTAIQAVASGSAEAGLTSVPALINANSAGLPVQGVVDIQTTLEGQPLQRWYVRADSPIKSLSDVVGKTYAVNLWKSSFHYTTLAALADAGVDPASVTFQLLSFPDQITALMAGEVDVIGLIPPYQGHLIQQFGGQVRELWNDYDFYGEKHVSLIFVNRVWAQHNPRVASAFALGVADAIKWSEEHQEEAAAIVGKYTGIEPSAIGNYHFTEGGAVRMGDVQWWLDWLRTNDGMTADWLKAEDVASNVYLDRE